MSHGVMAVTLARNGRPEEAEAALDRAYKPNVRGPFMVLAETASNNRTYFLTEPEPCSRVLFSDMPVLT